MSDAIIEPLRDRLRAAFQTERLAKHADALVAMAEPYVMLRAPDERSITLDEDDPRYVHLPYEQRAYAWRDDYRAQQARDLPLGASRLGFVPDLPPTVPWPSRDGKKLQFLAQIDLSAVPRWDGNPLPADGWLYAFAAFTPPKHWGPPLWRLTMLHHRGPRDALVRAEVPTSAADVWVNEHETESVRQVTYQLVPLTPVLGLTIGAARLYATPGMNERPDYIADYALDAVDEAFPPHRDEATDTAGCGYLLGHSAAIDGTPDEFAAIGRDGEPSETGWISLLTLLNAGSMYWGDAGRLYHVIRKADLAAEDFTDVRLAVGCS